MLGTHKTLALTTSSQYQPPALMISASTVALTCHASYGDGELTRRRGGIAACNKTRTCMEREPIDARNAFL